MTKDDRSEIREMLTDIIGAHTAAVDGKFDVIQVQLHAIREQTTKTNGRVTVLEEKQRNLETENNLHFEHCPHTDAINSLKNENVSRKAIYKFILASITISSGLVALIMELIK